MTAYDKKVQLLFKHGGTCQVERLLPHLVDNETLLDEKTIDELLVFTYLYSDLVQYYDNDCLASNHNAWRTFLENDDTVILSLILHTEIKKLRTLISNELLVLKKQKQSIENRYISRLLLMLEELIVLLNYWHKNLSNEHNVKLEIQNIAAYELNEHLTSLYSLLQHWDSQSGTESISRFCEFLERIGGEYSIWELVPDITHPYAANGDQVLENTISTLEDLFEVSINAIENLQRLARAEYTASLKHQQHTPQLALLIAVLRLLRHASVYLNKLPQRHLDFYYHEILKFRRKIVRPDRVHVHFKLRNDVHTFRLPRGMQLSAGKDAEGRDILFETTKPLIINRCTVNKIHKVYQVPHNHKDEGVLQARSLVATTQDVEQLNQSDERTTNNPACILPHAEDYPLGILIASPILYLKEGTREIRLLFKFHQKTFEKLLEETTRLGDATLEQLQERVIRLFKGAVDIQLTIAQGWFSLAEKYIAISISDQERHSFDVTITLPPSIPAIVNFDSKVHKASYKIQAPAIRFIMSDASKFGSLILFRNLQFEKLAIYVNVTGYRGLILQNDLGLVDGSHAFQPFGPLPQLHANFYLGSNEVFCKRLKKLNINIEWDNLPDVDGGFDSYYRGYPNSITNHDFQVNLSYLHQRQWTPFYPANRQKVALFTTQTHDSRDNTQRLVSQHSIEDIDLDKLNITRTDYSLTPPVLTPETLTGFIKMELCSPNMAFGHSIYPDLASNRVMENAQKKAHEAALPKLNPPYTPRVKSLSVDYSAHEEMILTGNALEGDQTYQQAFLKLSLFGYNQIFPQKGSARLDSFLSEANNVGCFFCFGFKKLDASILTLHIQIDENSIDPDEHFPKPTWQYLANNCWLDFGKERILSDSIKGLTKSGIITFKIPKTANQDNTLLEPGFVWLRAIFPKELTVLPNIVALHTQAVAAARIRNQDKVLDHPYQLSPRSIKSVVGSPAEIQAVVQPFSSFGGKPAESKNQFYTRASERLRHKNRAVSAWDYERLVLEKFPEIFRVKCINHSDSTSPFVPRPGQVMIIVIKKPTDTETSDAVTPRVSKQVLEAIKSYLQQVSSPFVHFEVMNPIYEEVKVNVEVKFKANRDPGALLNKLQRELRNFLSPWLFNNAEDIKLGDIIPSSKIIDFINRKEYIEGIGNFSILKYTGKDATLNVVKITDYDNYLRASYPWSVMMSADAHKISVVDEIHPQSGFRHGGITDMSIEEDFVVGPWHDGTPQAWDREVKKEALQESIEEYYMVTKKYIKEATTHGDRK